MAHLSMRSQFRIKWILLMSPQHNSSSHHHQNNTNTQTSTSTSDNSATIDAGIDTISSSDCCLSASSSSSPSSPQQQQQQQQLPDWILERMGSLPKSPCNDSPNNASSSPSSGSTAPPLCKSFYELQQNGISPSIIWKKKASDSNDDDDTMQNASSLLTAACEDGKKRCISTKTTAGVKSAPSHQESSSSTSTTNNATATPDTTTTTTTPSQQQQYPEYVTQPSSATDISHDWFRYQEALDPVLDTERLPAWYNVHGEEQQNDSLGQCEKQIGTNQGKSNTTTTTSSCKTPHPALLESIKILEDNYDIILSELQHILKDPMKASFQMWPENIVKQEEKSENFTKDSTEQPLLQEEEELDNKCATSSSQHHTGYHPIGADLTVPQHVSIKQKEELLSLVEEGTGSSTTGGPNPLYTKSPSAPSSLNPENAKWTVFGLIGFGRLLHENIKWAPKTYEIVKSLPLHVYTAGFSRMRPLTWIQPHCGYKGYSEHVLRVHLPIIVPKYEEGAVDSCSGEDSMDSSSASGVKRSTNANCFLMCHNEKRRWRQGECLVFDDSLTHCAWNLTNQTRVVLLLDVKYPWKPWFHDDGEPDIHTSDFTSGLQNMLHSIDLREMQQGGDIR